MQAGDKVYIAGGFLFNDYVGSKEIDIFDLSTKQLNGKMPMNHSRGDITTLTESPNIYFVGGRNYINRPLVYSTDVHDFEETSEMGSTVRNLFTGYVMQLSIYQSTLVVIGDYSADFYNLTSETWRSNEELTRIMTNVTKSCIKVAGRYIYIIGGRNVNTGSRSLTLSVYDIQTDSVIDQQDVLPDDTDTSTAECAVDTMEDVMVYKKRTYFVAYQIESRQWFRIDLPEVLQSVTIANTTFVFNSTSFYWINWQTGDKTLTSVLFTPTFVNRIGNSVMYWRTGGNSLQYGIMSAPSWAQSENTVAIPPSLLLAGISPPLIIPPNRFALWGGNQLSLINIEFNSVFQLTTSPNIHSVMLHPTVNNAILISCNPASPQLLTVPLSSPASYTSESVDMLVDRVVGTDYVSILTGFVGPDLNASNPVSVGIYSTNDFQFGQEDDQLVLMRMKAVAEPYQFIDVYNYEQQKWSDPIEIPPELSYTNDGRHIAGLLDGKLVLWSPNVTGYYDLEHKNWSIISQQVINLALQNGVYSIEIPAVSINSTVYLRPTNALYFNTFDFEHQWRTTRVEHAEGYLMEQTFLYGNTIFVSTLNNYSRDPYLMYAYNTGSDTWQPLQFEGINSSMSIAKVGDYLALFDSQGNTKSLYLPQQTWEDLSTTDYTSGILFSVSLEASYNNELIGLLAGGQYAFTGLSTDVMFILTDDGVRPFSQSPLQSPAPAPSGGLSGNIIAAIVVPIVAVAIAAALLAIFLVRRNNKKRRQGRENASMTGLEAKYGEWYTPFSDIKFGQQLGQGASGQVFEGTWKNTKVALKVSSTQANQSVIGELELMMKLRPHPNVVQLLGFSVHPETQSIILIIEFCNQGSLDSTLYDDKRNCEMSQKMSWLVGISKGLGHLHANNIVHRDVAARNVLLHQNEAKITDFGMSRLIDEQKQHGTTKSELGPIRWMAPESLKAKQYSSKSGKK
jgi:hypothetical protein